MTFTEGAEISNRAFKSRGGFEPDVEEECTFPLVCSQTTEFGIPRSWTLPDALSAGLAESLSNRPVTVP
ncbi:MAG TPA: hypothetical protein VNQ76_05270, partial [Planctomicrobium sp.]|nr:hypothetical protein [Planctomicrobium sp.]